ncbi:MAG: hypothetical protein ACK4UR_01795 [Caldimicrobium sp.]
MKTFVIFGIIFYFLSEALSGERIFIYAVKKPPRVPAHFYFIEDPKIELCRYKKVLIYGAESFKESLNYRCDNQKRIVAGVLYLNYFYHPKYIYVSPLPSSKIIRSYGIAFSVIHSDFFSFYTSYLKRDIRLEEIVLKNWYEMERALKEVKGLGLPLLLLPDPIVMDERVQILLKGQLKEGQIRVINLIGKPLNLPNEILISPFQENHFRFIQKIYFDDTIKEGSILYWD